MRGLSILRLARRWRRDRGATSAIVVILLGGGVLFGAAALSVDMGSIMWERRQLQNGADAVAQSMAQLCAKNASACTTAGALTQAALNNANAADGRNGMDSSRYPNGVCGHNVPGLPPCQPSTGQLWDCPPVKAGLGSAVPYVEAHTVTTTSNGSGLLSPFFSGASGNAGSAVRACARSAWGQPGAYSTSVPIIFSFCEWNSFTSGGTSYYANPVGTVPGYGGAGQPAWPPVSMEKALFLKDQAGATGCKFWGTHDMPGGFGYLSSGAGCMTLVATGNWAQVDTGSSATVDCRAAMAALRGRAIDLPIFDCVTTSGTAPNFTPTATSSCNAGGGANSWYHIKGWARFYVSGYKIGGSDQMPNYVSGAVPCSGPNRCVAGWFLSGSLNATTMAPPDPQANFGTYVVLPAG